MTATPEVEKLTRPPRRLVSRIIDELAGVTLTEELAEQIVTAARARISAPVRLAPELHEHEHTAECARPESSCPDA